MISLNFSTALGTSASSLIQSVPNSAVQSGLPGLGIFFGAIDNITVLLGLVGIELPLDILAELIRALALGGGR